MSHKRMRDPTENDSILKQVTEGMAADWGKKETERAIYLAALRMTGYVCCQSAGRRHLHCVLILLYF